VYFIGPGGHAVAALHVQSSFILKFKRIIPRFSTVNSPLLSIILVFRNQKESAEETLTVLYEQLDFPFELFVADNTSDDGTADAIRSVISHFNHEETYYFEYTEYRGRGPVIQELLSHCNGAVLWMPMSLRSVDARELQTQINALREKGVLFGVSGALRWPEDVTQWTRIFSADYDLSVSGLSDDTHMLVNLSRIPSRSRFVNPYLNNWLALEWMVRMAFDPRPSGESVIDAYEAGMLFITAQDYIVPGGYIAPSRDVYGAVIELQASLKRCNADKSGFRAVIPPGFVSDFGSDVAGETFSLKVIRKAKSLITDALLPEKARRVAREPVTDVRHDGDALPGTDPDTQHRLDDGLQIGSGTSSRSDQQNDDHPAVGFDASDSSSDGDVLSESDSSALNVVSKYTTAFIEGVEESAEDNEPQAEGRDAASSGSAGLDAFIEGADELAEDNEPQAEGRVAASFGSAGLDAFIEGVNARILPFVSSRNKVKDFVEPGCTGVAAAIKPHIDFMVHEGEYPDALKLINEAIEVNPDNSDLINIKIRLLQRMRRYVEAAELKHMLRLRSAGQQTVTVRREKIVIVDPSEDTSVPARIDDQDKPYPSRPARDFRDTAGITGKEGTSPQASESHTDSQSDSSAGLSASAIKSRGNFGEASGLKSSVIAGGASTLGETKQGLKGAGDSGADSKSSSAASSRPVRRINMVLGGEDLPADFDLYKMPVLEPYPEDSETITPVEDSSVEDSSVEDPSAAEVDQTDDTTSEYDDAITGNPDVEQSHESDSREDDSAEERVPEVSLTTVSVNKSSSDSHRIRISIIVPTTADGKHMLENLLISVARHANQPDRELIVVDNASLDGTYSYLKQLHKDRFMNIRVITNNVNRGFAASVNQGLDLARGTYAFVIHNDVTLTSDAPGKLADLMDSSSEVALMGPVAAVTMHQEQRLPQPDSNPDALRFSEVLDSFAIMLRRSAQLRFDERYQMAWFEDVDLCTLAWQSGYKVAIARGVLVEHLGGATSTVVGCGHLGRCYWKNTARFNEKWGAEPDLPYFGEGTSPIFQLITISEIINPYYPEARLLARASQLLSSETRHDIIKATHARADLFALIRLMMVLDVRDVLRQLEDQLDTSHPDETLLYQLIEFYYQKHIYSRSMNYLKQLEPHQRSFRFRLMELSILMGDKKLEEATDLLNELLTERPAAPELYKIAGDIHLFYGNKKEASRFYLLAHQADPFRFSERRDLVY
jgi:GT2 family glycosyltransferase